MSFDLRRARLDLGKTLDELAEATGVPKATLGRAERGETEPRPGAKHAIAAYYTAELGREISSTDIWPVPAIDQEEAAAA